MLKYLDAKVTLAEVPDEVSLCISITGCKLHCKGCHSPELREDIGTPLLKKELIRLLNVNPGITCVCFLGGEHHWKAVEDLAFDCKVRGLKTAWYIGTPTIPSVDLYAFDYIKVGSYKEECGPLTSKTTNQRMYKIMEDITNKFWK